jgi:GR25 family glycosyltransferase involved in LPS biosynthesis
MNYNAQNASNWQSLFPNVKILKAIVGTDVDLTDTSKITPLVRFQINDISKNDSVFSMPSRGGIGCYLSHIECMKKCVELGKPIVIIEEDVNFTESAKQTIAATVRNIPADCDLLSLLYIRHPNHTAHDQNFIRITGSIDGTQCYIIYPSAAKKILENCFPMTTQIDLFIGIILFLHPDIKGYAVKKRLYSLMKVLTDNFSTSTQTFAVKKYLPSGNLFYYVTLSLFVLLIVISIYLYKTKKSEK